MTLTSDKLWLGRREGYVICLPVSGRAENPLGCKLLLDRNFDCGPVAQLDRASDFGSEGWGFDSLRGRQNLKAFPLSGRRLKLSAYISPSDLLLQNPDPTNWRRFPNSGLTNLNFCLFLHSSFPANIRRE